MQFMTLVVNDVRYNAFPGSETAMPFVLLLGTNSSITDTKICHVNLLSCLVNIVELIIPTVSYFIHISIIKSDGYRSLLIFLCYSLVKLSLLVTRRLQSIFYLRSQVFSMFIMVVVLNSIALVFVLVSEYLIYNL